MRRILLLFLFAVISGITAFAQDVIITKDSKKITGKVLEVNTDNIKYKDSKNQEGPVYTLLKKEIASILYENGEVETFEDKTADKSAPTAKKSSTLCSYDPVLDNVRWYGNRVLIDNRRASSKEIREMMRKTSPKSYKLYSAGRGLTTAGTILLATGGAFFAGGVACVLVSEDVDEEDDDDLIIIGVIVGAVGTVEMITSIPLLVVGKGLKNRGIKNFGQNCLSDEPLKTQDNYRLNLNVNSNGLGLAFVF